MQAIGKNILSAGSPIAAFVGIRDRKVSSVPENVRKVNNWMGGGIAPYHQRSTVGNRPPVVMGYRAALDSPI
jgi:hypothetical protein